MVSVNTHGLEIKRWLEELTFLKQENTALKLRLSELVDNSIHKEFLLKAESLNNELLTNDESIRLLTDSATYLQNKFSAFSEDQSASLLEKKVQLGKDIKTFKKRFKKLNHHFFTQLTRVN